jgi:ribose 1,5-bisphosphate isomerase
MVILFMTMIKEIPEDYIKEIFDLEQDHVHGSTFILKKSIDILITLTESYESTEYSVSEITNKYIPILSAIIKAQPQMGLIFTIVNEFLFFLDTTNQENPKKDIITYLTMVKESIYSNSALLLTYVKTIIPKNAMILTYSSSSSIIESLIQLFKEGIFFEVICSESRPRNEGISTAEILANHSIPVTLCTDAYLFSHIDQADIVLIGADTICKYGVVNKIGSFPLISIVRHFDIPRYVLCDTRKIIPNTYTLPVERLKPAGDITIDTIPEKLSIINKYFDYTPLDLFTYIITEKGFMSIQRVKEQMNKGMIHKALLPYL